MLTYPRAIVLGLVQGVTELLPISSSGHLVIVPAWLRWDDVLSDQGAEESVYLAFIVAIHVATAVALVVYFRNDWASVVGGFFRTLRTRQVSTPNERMPWLVVIGTIPAGLGGLLLRGPLESAFASPFVSSCFLMVTGVVLFVVERSRRVAAVERLAHEHATKPDAPHARRLETLNAKDAAVVGVSQVVALLPGISRSGITMAAGLLRGFDHKDAARFSFLLATPVILGAGLYEIPVLFDAPGGIWGPVLVGSAIAAVAAYVSLHFLFRFYRRGNLVPFAMYCVVVGAISVARFA